MAGSKPLLTNMWLRPQRPEAVLLGEEPNLQCPDLMLRQAQQDSLLPSKLQSPNPRSSTRIRPFAAIHYNYHRSIESEGHHS